MTTIKKELIVQAPLEKVYNQWTQFEEFPHFMHSVTEVRQLDDRRLLWRAHLLGQEFEWEAEIEEQIPDARIEWRSLQGQPHTGSVRFEPWEVGETRVLLEVDYEPDGIAAALAGALGLVGHELDEDLTRFKTMVEDLSEETGAWRGTITGDGPPADERAIAEERQRRPGPASLPGGTPISDDLPSERRFGEG